MISISHEGEMLVMNTGFPSPAQYYRGKNMNLNEYLAPHPESTFFMRVKTSSYEAFQVQKGDLLIIDRSCTPRINDLIIAISEGRRLLMKYTTGNEESQSLPASFEIWGTITSIVHFVHLP
jgi:DNA polymerase V